NPLDNGIWTLNDTNVIKKQHNLLFQSDRLKARILYRHVKKFIFRIPGFHLETTLVFLEPSHRDESN
ncbi:11681_t:CDS:2, partial [Racocetra persica]